MPDDERASDGDDATDATDTTDATHEDTAGVGDRLVATWTGLDRGWQALLLGVAIVAVHLLGQVL